MTTTSQIVYKKADGTTDTTEVKQYSGAPAGGAYVYERIGDRTTRRWVPAGVKEYAGSKTGKYGVKAGAHKVVDTTQSRVVVGNQEGTVKTTEPSEQAKAAREKALSDAAAKGQQLTAAQQAELQENQRKGRTTVTIALDMQALEQQREQLKAAGVYDNYLDYLQGRTTRPPEDQAVEPQYFTLPPRVPHLSETMTIRTPINVRVPYNTTTTTGSMNAEAPTSDARRPAAVRAWSSVTQAEEELQQEATEPGKELYKVPAFAAGVAYTAASTVMNQASNTFNFLIEETPKLELWAPKPWKEKDFSALDINAWGDFAQGVVAGTVEGTGELVAGVVEQFQKRDVQGIVEQGAAAVAAGYQADLVSRPAARAVREAPNMASRARFIEATQYPPGPPGSSGFNPRLYTSEGRQGVFVPAKIDQAYGGLAGISNKGVLQAPELQTQLEPKKLGEPNIKPETPLSNYQPMSLAEIAKKNPELARRLAQESGQTTFNELPIYRELTEAERLAVAKAQAEANRPAELQKTLPGTRPKTNSVVILKNNKEVARIENGKTVEVKQPPVFATDPIGGVIASIDLFKDDIAGGARDIANKLRIQQRLEKFGRSSLEATPTGGFLRERPGLTGSGFVIENRYGDASAPIITAVILPAIKARNGAAPGVAVVPGVISEVADKTIQDPWQGTGGGTRSRSNTRQDQAAGQEIAPSQDQAQQQETTTRQELIKQPWPRQEPPKTREDPRPWPEPKTRQDNKPAGPARFKAMIRRRGVFQSAGIFNTEPEAQRAAEDIIRNTAGAAFKITDTEGKSQPVNPTTGFKPSKRERGVIVQERNQRIKTVGEKREITYGPKPRKKKGAGQKIFGGKTKWGF